MNNEMSAKQIKDQLDAAKKHFDLARRYFDMAECSIKRLADRFSEIANELSFEGHSLKSARKSGVYFLHLNGSVVYIGQAKNILRRIGSHTDKDFDRVTFVNCDDADLNDVEEFFIALIQPPANKRKPPAFPNVRCAIQNFDDLSSRMH